MPELAAAYAAGVAMTLCLVGMHIYLQSRKQKSAPLRQVQANLKKINFFWSETESQIKDYTVGAERKDVEKSIRSILISGIVLAFLSWLGLFLQFAVMLSLRYLAVERIEILLFESELAKKDLIAEKSREILAQIMKPFPPP